MLGIPANVSIAIRIILTILFPFLLYSTRKIAVPIPKGAAITIEIPTRINVPTIADGKVGFSSVYFPNKT